MPLARCVCSVRVYPARQRSSRITNVLMRAQTDIAMCLPEGTRDDQVESRNDQLAHVTSNADTYGESNDKTMYKAILENEDVAKYGNPQECADLILDWFCWSLSVERATW